MGPFEKYEPNSFLKVENLQKSQFLSKEVFVYVSTKRAAYKMNKVCFLTLFVDKCFKNCFWVGHTFLQKLLSFKRFSILEENCGADIKNGAFKCNIFVDKCYKKRWLSGSYFPTKAKIFQVSQHFRRKLWCRHL